MWSRRLYLALSLSASLTACLLTGNVLAEGEAPAAARPSAPAAVLYDQINNPGTNSVTSQNFEPDLDSFDNQAADDFVVPAGEFWTVTSVEISGTYAGSAVVDSVNVQFYNNTGAGLPGGQSYSGTFVPSGGLNTGSFIITLSPPPYLGPGLHWVSLQANMNFGPGNAWQWQERTVQSNQAAAYRMPGGGGGAVPPACTNWAALALTCFADQGHSPDLLFRLNGTSAPAHSLFLPLARR